MELYNTELYEESTSTDGTFPIEHLQPGTYTLLISSIDNTYMTLLDTALAHVNLWHDHVSLAEGEHLVVPVTAP
jgi:hypothetical protein